MFKNKVLVVILLFICWTVYAAVDENLAVKKDEIVTLRREVANLQTVVDELKDVIADLRSSGKLKDSLLNRTTRQTQTTQNPRSTARPKQVGKEEVVRRSGRLSY